MRHYPALEEGRPVDAAHLLRMAAASADRAAAAKAAPTLPKGTSPRKRKLAGRARLRARKAGTARATS